MKQIYILLGAVLLANGAWAQCADMTWDETFMLVEPGDNHEFYVYIDNLQAHTDSFTVHIENDVPDGWQTFMCVEGACLLPFITTTRIEVVPEYPDTAYVHINSNTVPGTGSVVFSAVPDNCPGETHSVAFTLYTDPDGVTGYLPNTPVLLHAYPNPFNPATTVNYTLNNPGQVSLALYSIEGRRVAEPVPATYHASGRHSVTVLGDDLPSGVYIVALTTASGNYYSKISLIK